MTAPNREVRRYDPDRRDRIIDACLDVIARVGVAGVSHRKVADAADVPLGSMTYHFSGMHDLLHQAFSRFADQASLEFADQMATAADPASARQSIVDAILDHPTRSSRTLVLTQELYTLAARDPEYRDITNAWMRRSRDILARHFDPSTARMVDALIEGLTLHQALDLDDGHNPYSPGIIGAAVHRITSPETTP